MAEGPSDHVVIGNLPADLTDDGLKANFEAYGNIKWCRLFGGKGGATKTAIIEFSSVEEATWLVENLDGNVPLGLETEVTVKFKPKNAGKAGGGGGGGEKGAWGGGGGGGGCEGGKGRPGPYGGGGGGGKGGNIMTQGMMKGGKSGMGGMMMMMGAMAGGQPSTIQDLWKGLLRHKVLPGGSWANDERTVCIQGLPSDTTEADLLKIFSPFGAILPGGVRVTLNPDGTAKGSGMVNFMNLEDCMTAIETLNNCMLPDGRFLRLKQYHDWGKGAKGGEKGEKGGKGGKGGGGLITPGGGGETEG